MRNSWQHRWHRLFLTLVALFCVGSAWANAAEQIQVIAHGPEPGSSLTTTQLRTIYSLRLEQWPDGTPLHVFVLPSGHPVHEKFAKEVLQTFPNQLDRLWNRLVYAGLSQGPQVVESEAAMLSAVKETPGSIGYVGTVAPVGVMAVEVVQ